MPPVAEFTQPNCATQLPEVYKANIDGGFAVHHRLAGHFAPHAAAVPNMTVVVDAGYIPFSTSLASLAQQTTAVITAPVGNPRIDRVVVDRYTGAVSVVAGTPAATPVAPAIPADKLPVAQVLLTVGMTAIGNSAITDERIATPTPFPQTFGTTASQAAYGLFAGAGAAGGYNRNYYGLYDNTWNSGWEMWGQHDSTKFSLMRNVAGVRTSKLDVDGSGNIVTPGNTLSLGGAGVNTLYADATNTAVRAGSAAGGVFFQDYLGTGNLGQFTSAGSFYASGNIQANAYLANASSTMILNYKSASGGAAALYTYDNGSPKWAFGQNVGSSGAAGLGWYSYAGGITAMSLSSGGNLSLAGTLTASNIMGQANYNVCPGPNWLYNNTYTQNTSGRHMLVSFNAGNMYTGASGCDAFVSSNGSTDTAQVLRDGGGYHSAAFIVPPGWYWKCYMKNYASGVLLSPDALFTISY